MKIGIDLDGVVIDSETTFRTYEEIFDIDILKGNNLINKEEPKFQARYNWTDEQQQEFIEKCKKMKDDAIRLLEENNIKFNKYYWKVEDKLEVCKNEKLEENEYIKEVNNWGEIYRYIKENYILKTKKYQKNEQTFSKTL